MSLFNGLQQILAHLLLKDFIFLLVGNIRDDHQRKNHEQKKDGQQNSPNGNRFAEGNESTHPFLDIRIRFKLTYME